MSGASIVHGLLVAVAVVAWFVSFLASTGAGAYVGERVADRHRSIDGPLAAGIGAALAFIVWVAINVGVVIAVTNPGPMS